MKEFRRYKLLCRLLSPIPGTGRHEIESIGQEGLDWPEVFRVAGDHFVTPLLAGALESKGLFEQLPEDIRNYLDAIRQLNLERNETLKTELHFVIGKLNEIDVQPLLLKGAINLVTEQYPGCRDRVIGDLDLAIPEDRIKESFQWLNKEPYRAEVAIDRAHELGLWHHAPPLLHESLPVTIELHRHVIGDNARKFLPTDATWQNSISHSLDGLSFRLPSPTDRLFHTFAHTQLQDRNHAHRRLALRPLCEFVNQRTSLAPDLDWNSIQVRLGRKHSWKLETYLLATHELFNQEPPAAISIGYGAKRRMEKIRTRIDSPKAPRFSHIFNRLKKLPHRLVTPAWYSAKFRALRRGDPW